MKKPKNSLELPNPTRNIRKCSNKLMTHTSGEINLQSLWVYGMAPYYLTSKFCNRASIHGRKTRNGDQLQIPLYTSAAGQRSFKFRGAKIWNSLDTDLKEHKSLKNFKLALKSRLFSNLYK